MQLDGALVADDYDVESGDLSVTAVSGGGLEKGGGGLLLFLVQPFQQDGHVGMPPLPVPGVVDKLLAGGGLDEGPVLVMLVGASTALDRGRTRSKAAILVFLGAAGPASFGAVDVPWGAYFPTMREVGVSSFTALSDQVSGSGGFWEVGLKNEETAFSILKLGSKLRYHLLGLNLLVVVD